MNISYQQIVGKIEQELAKAKEAHTEEQIKAHFYAIKTLAEVIAGGEEEKQANVKATLPTSQPFPQSSQQATTISMPSEKPIKFEDGNGDSLFDF